MKYGYFLVLSLIFFTLLHGVSANDGYYYEIHQTHIEMSHSFFVHQGDVKKIKAELYGNDRSIFGQRSEYGLFPDYMLNKKMLYLNLYGPAVNGNNLYIESSSKTNWWGNVYFKINTKNLEPGAYNFTVEFDAVYPEGDGIVWESSSKNATLYVLPKN